MDELQSDTVGDTEHSPFLFHCSSIWSLSISLLPYSFFKGQTCEKKNICLNTNSFHCNHRVMKLALHTRWLQQWNKNNMPSFIGYLLKPKGNFRTAVMLPYSICNFQETLTARANLKNDSFVKFSKIIDENCKQPRATFEKIRNQAGQAPKQVIYRNKWSS